MAKSHSRKATFHLDNAAGSLIDITAYCDGANLSDQVASDQVTVLGQNAHTYLEGLAGTTVQLSGPLDGVLYTQLAAIRQSDATRSIQYRPFGAGVGLPQITAESYLSAFSINAAVGGPVTFSATLTCTGAVTYGAQ